MIVVGILSEDKSSNDSISLTRPSLSVNILCTLSPSNFAAVTNPSLPVNSVVFSVALHPPITQLPK
ncbi:hypothetical protein HanIR_Chr17g0877601 [Helianthus annuus]|nr:hypothetical protein HanIR_Chr17g0877601 [Helianthus annuus]